VLATESIEPETGGRQPKSTHTYGNGAKKPGGTLSSHGRKKKKGFVLSGPRKKKKVHWKKETVRAKEAKSLIGATVGARSQQRGGSRHSRATKKCVLESVAIRPRSQNA